MKSREINSLFKNLSKEIKNPKSDLKYKKQIYSFGLRRFIRSVH